MNGSWQDFLANKILHRPSSRTSHLLGHRKISRRWSRTILNVGGSTSAHRWTQAPSDWYKAQQGAVATVRSPVATSESGLPSVRREDLENAIFLDPPFVPVKIVFYRMVSMFLPFFGHIYLEGFDCDLLCKYWVTIQLFSNFSEVDGLFRHAESSCCTGWCFPNYCCHSSGQHLDIKLSLLIYFFFAKLNSLTAK